MTPEEYFNDFPEVRIPYNGQLDKYLRPGEIVEVYRRQSGKIAVYINNKEKSQELAANLKSMLLAEQSS